MAPHRPDPTDPGEPADPGDRDSEDARSAWVPPGSQTPAALPHVDNSPGGAVQVLTPAGRGAVAVVEFRACGFATGIRVLDTHFQCLSAVGLRESSADRILYGTWHREQVVVVRTAPATWEIHCHGGTAAVAAIVDQLRQSCRLPAQDALADSTGTESVPETLDSQIQNALIRTRTLRTAAHVLAQTQGRLRSRLEQLIVEPSPARMSDLLADILQWQEFARHLTEPWRVLILGPPNVGKSSLVNALAGFERAIVSEQAGTTRDLVEVPLILAQWPFVICDSAGVRSETADQIEQAGIAAAVAAVRTCDAWLLVCDGSRQEAPADWLAAVLRGGAVPDAIVKNKCDLSGPFSTRMLPDVPEGCPVIETSALTGQGTRQLSEWLVSYLIPVEPELGAPLPVTQPLREVLRELRTSLHDPRSIRNCRGRLQLMLAECTVKP